MAINWEGVVAEINRALPTGFEFSHATQLSGGCINQAYRVSSSEGQHFFIKLNAADKLAMFATERIGLEALAATRTVRVPLPITQGVAGAHSFFVLEYFELSERGNAALLGQQLAALHRSCAAEFGFAQANTLGATPQINDWQTDWVTFWREQRLGLQLTLAASNGYGGQLQSSGRQLLERLPEFFAAYQPHASLLHGDLWGGNHAYLPNGAPVLFDPAVYYGDRETDLAMTELFGGFDPAFYAAYRAAWPLDAGYETRKVLYNLYHILNHANLFGGGYAQQAASMTEWLLRQLNASSPALVRGAA